MTEVTIQYCVPCGFRERALAVQEAILNALERELDRCSLVMGDHGVFRVTVDGEAVYDKHDDGEADVDELVRAVRARC